MRSFALRVVIVSAILATAAIGAPVVEDSRIRSHLDSASIALGGTARLLVEVRGPGAADAEIDELPHIEGLALELEPGPVTTLDGATGELQSSFVISIRPLVEGSFRIGGIQVVLRSDLALNVSEERLVVGREAASSLAFEVSVGRSETVVGEVFEVEFQLGAEPPAGARLRLPWLDSLTIAEFPSLKDTGPTRNAIEVVGSRATVGVVLSKLEGSEGTPARRGVLRVFASRPSRLDLSGSTFEYGPTAESPKVLAARPIEIEVRPLPPGAPKEFVDAVGDFALSASVDRETVFVGEIVRLSIGVEPMEGRTTNLLHAIFTNAPRIEGFRVLGRNDQRLAKNREGSGGASDRLTMEFEIAASAPREGVPPIAFASYDPATRGYRELRTPALPLHVVVPSTHDVPVARGDEKERSGGIAKKVLIAILGAVVSYAVQQAWVRSSRRRRAVPGESRGSVGGEIELRAIAERLATVVDPFDLDTARDFARGLAIRLHCDPGAVFPASSQRDAVMRTLDPSIRERIERYFDAVEKRAFGGGSSRVESVGGESREEFLALVRVVSSN